MKKIALRVMLVTLVLGGKFNSFGKSVSENTAKEIGCHYLLGKKVQGVNTPNDLIPAYTAESRIAGKTVVDFFVFNVTGNSGFVIISGDDKIIPVLAYSETSSFDINNIGPAATGWINWYKRQIEYVIAHDLDAQPGTEAIWNDLKKNVPSNVAAKTTSVSPLVTTKWNQNPYYNALCPGSGSAKTVTGCVATAMAQVMKFWNWPVVGAGTHTYTHPTYGALTANFGATTYQWSSMPNSISGSNTAIATLMYHCGVSVNMNYGTAAAGGSGSWPVSHYSEVVNCSEYAFKTYFHYKSTIKGILRSGSTSGVTPITAYTTGAWISALKAELDAGRPFIYTGNDGTSGGHAWVCDGYNSGDNKFHFNWGWGGGGPDGYYSVDDVSPPSLGTGGSGGNFNYTQTATIGIQPDTYPSYTDDIKMKSYFNFTSNMPLKYRAPISFKTKILNGRSTAFNGDICAQVYDASNVLMGTVQTHTATSIAAGDSSALLTFSTTGMPSLLSQKYTVRMMYRNTGVTTWSPVGNNGDFKNHSAIDVKNDTGMRLFDTIKVTTGLPMYSWAATSIKAVVHNRADLSFNGSVRAQLVNVNTGGIWTLKTVSEISIGGNLKQTIDFGIPSLAVPAGTYALEILHQYNNTGSFHTVGSKDYANPRLVQVISVNDITTPREVPNEVFIYPNPAKDVLNILFNGHEVKEVVIADMAGRVIYRSFVEAGTAKLQVPANGFAPGIYVVQLHGVDNVTSKKITISE